MYACFSSASLITVLKITVCEICDTELRIQGIKMKGPLGITEKGGE